MTDKLNFDEFFVLHSGDKGVQNQNSANTYVGTKHPGNKFIPFLKGLLIGLGIVFCIYNKDKILAFIFWKRPEESEPEDIKIY